MAEDAAALSPVDEAVPVPTIVVITPVDASTLRMRLLLVSVMYMLLSLSSTTSSGTFNVALVAGPLSPVYPPVELATPATLLIIPVATVILRMMLNPDLSPKYILPALSRFIPAGYLMVAEVAAPPSPLEPMVPVPAIVLITLVEAVILRIRLL